MHDSLIDLLCDGDYLSPIRRYFSIEALEALAAEKEKAAVDAATDSEEIR
ncbi:hypothetical protein SOV_04450 [Sporomusa ovata DSM 2662]|uniref:Uncharacterized protein n=1 Tax=Sporomusa ovata TaxID=2378 RepID=A0A0U1KW40_9FIRM|nr:hypothetical protein [Sporomusa ovata]EQB28115.1 hypothetical protein SOV_2c10380 [Sporomusa ovata DSM 2662]CQR71652.1 hypothetical protein SpAn4DRAFT_3518 [Sporomusa ovata]